MHRIRKIGKLFIYIGELIKYICLNPIGRLMYGKREIFIFAERGTDARDNGYHMYRYFRQEHPELESYYIITNDSADRKKVEALGNVVTHSSLKHYLLFFGAKYKVSSHNMGCSPNVGFYSRFSGILQLKGKRIFLQHGVIKDYIAGLCYPKFKTDLFICGAEPEYEFIQHRFGHPSGVVQYTGLARYDRLQEFITRNQILVMPTWRDALRTDKDFLGSEYFRRWQGFISNKDLLTKLEETDTKLYFYVHYEMQKYIKHFKTDSQQIVLAKFEDYDVQTLLKESKLLITDFSSVYFDFAYMKKPVVYYQFDQNHYGTGYFDYGTMGFGDVCNDENAVVECVARCFENNFQMELQYLERTQQFFPLHDGNNCKRIYDCIIDER